MYKDGVLYRAMVDGIMAKRKLNGDLHAYGPDDPTILKALVAQGERAEATLREEGKLKTIEKAMAAGQRT